MLYQCGDAFEIADKERELLGEAQSYKSQAEYDLAYAEALKGMRGVGKNIRRNDDTRLFRLWAGSLVNSGKQIDDEVDSLLGKIISCNENWWSNRKKIEKLLNQLLILRESIRNFEADSEDYLLHLSTIAIIGLTDFGNPVSTMVSNLNSSFSRAFDLCALKITSINSGRVTVTNVFISIVALIVAVASLLVSLRK